MEVERQIRAPEIKPPSIPFSIKRYLVALKNTPFVVSLVDCDLRFSWIFPGIPPSISSELLGKRLDLVLPIPEVRQIIRIEQEVLRSGTLRKEEVVLRLRRETRTYQLIMEPVRSSTGELIGIVLLAYDHSRKASLEATFRGRISNFERVAESVPDVVFTRSTGLHFEFFNQRFYQWTGLRPEAALGEGWMQAIHRLDLNGVITRWNEAVVKEGNCEVEFRLRMVDGSYRWCEMRAFPQKVLGLATQWLGVLTDIDELKRSENERNQLLDIVLEEHEETKNILHQMPAGVIICDAPTDKIIFGNKRAEEIFGSDVTSDNFASHKKNNLYREDGRRIAPYETPLSRALKGETINSESLKYQREDGTWIYLSANAAPIRDKKGRIVAAVVAFEDTTERRLAERAQRKSEQRLRRLNETLQDRVESQTAALEEKAEEVRYLASELTIAEQLERRRIAQILHDGLQQYLYGLLLHIQALKGDVPENFSHRVEEIEDILKQTIQVNRTLTIELSPPALHSEGLHAALQWLASQMHDLHGLHVDLDVDGAFSHVDQEVRILIFRFVRELLFNVVKHACVDRARVIARQVKKDLIVRVEDDGIGFDAKTQTHESGTRGSFGLFTARERLRLFGGTLKIRSSPGTGTSISIIVPLS